MAFLKMVFPYKSPAFRPCLVRRKLSGIDSLHQFVFNIRLVLFPSCLGMEDLGNAFHEFFSLLNLIRMGLIFKPRSILLHHTAFEFRVIRLFHKKRPSLSGYFNGHFTPSQVVQFSRSIELRHY